MLFFGNRTACAVAGSCVDQINGGSATVLNGALYFKSDEIAINGAANASGYMMLVADKIYINSDSTFGITGDPFDGITVSVSPASSSLFASEQQQFSATVSNTGNLAVTWSISPAGIGGISSSGLYTAPSIINAQQTVTVTATSQADTSKSGTATITLNPVSISLSPPTASLYAQQTQQFTPSVTNTSNTAVTWSLSPTGVGSISAGGLYTAPASITAQQSVTVKVTSQADPTKSASATVTLLAPVSVSVNPPSVSLYASQTQQFTSSVTNTSNTSVTWSITPAIGTINSAGLFTAPSTIASQQTVTVRATSVADPTKSASASVTLIPPVSVSVSPTSVSLNGGATQAFAAVVSNTANQAVTWSISPVGSGTITSAGLYTAPATVVSAQTVTITATSQADSTKSASASVTLVPLSITVSPVTAGLLSGQTQQFTATVTHASNLAVVWSISPAGAGSISASGLYSRSRDHLYTTDRNCHSDKPG